MLIISFISIITGSGAAETVLSTVYGICIFSVSFLGFSLVYLLAIKKTYFILCFLLDILSDCDFECLI